MQPATARRAATGASPAPRPEEVLQQEAHDLGACRHVVAAASGGCFGTRDRERDERGCQQHGAPAFRRLELFRPSVGKGHPSAARVAGPSALTRSGPWGKKKKRRRTNRQPSPRPSTTTCAPRSRGSSATAAGGRDAMARYGVASDKAFGVSMANIQVLARHLGRSHELAAALWATDRYEARMLTAFVDEPERVTGAQMDRWCRDFDNWAIVDTLCFHLFDRTPRGVVEVEPWSAETRRVRQARGLRAPAGPSRCTTRPRATRRSSADCALIEKAAERRTQLREEGREHGAAARSAGAAPRSTRLRVARAAAGRIARRHARAGSARARCGSSRVRGSRESLQNGPAANV